MHTPRLANQLADAKAAALQSALDFQAACSASKPDLLELDRLARHTALMLAELRIAIRAVTIRLHTV